MKQIDKEYRQSFLIEPTKLTRLVDKIHERLGVHTDMAQHDSFEVFLSGNRHEVITNVDSVLELENSRKHRIERLLINCSAATKGVVRPEHEVQVDFGVEKKTQGAPTATRIVEISVRSDAPGWASRTLSEVEEQVERTWMKQGIPVAVLGAFLIVLLFGILAMFVQVDTTRPTTQEIVRSMWLRDADADRLEQLVGQNRTITDEEMREIETRQLRNILRDYKPPTTQQPGTWRQTLLILVPLLTLAICAVILLNCYPTRVFLWGDEVERYAAVVQRRKLVWNVIIGVVVVGVVGNLLSAKILSSFSK